MGAHPLIMPGKIWKSIEAKKSVSEISSVEIENRCIDKMRRWSITVFKALPPQPQAGIDAPRQV